MQETEGQKKRRIWQHTHDTDGAENVYADMFLGNCEETAVQCVLVRQERVRTDPNEYVEYQHDSMYRMRSPEGHYELRQDEELTELKFD